MPSIAKFDTWQNRAGTSTFGTVVQVAINRWHTQFVSSGVQYWQDIPNSDITIVTRVANSSINLVFQGQSYKSNSAGAASFGLQLYRVAPHPLEVSNPYTTWGSSSHDNGTTFASNVNLAHTDYPMLPAGSTVTYRLRLWNYDTTAGAYINYNGPNSRWGAVGTNSAIGYNNGSNIIATEIAP